MVFRPLTTIRNGPDVPPSWRRSRVKLWIRTLIFAIFSTLFGLALSHDIGHRIFRWSWAGLVFLPCLPLGFLLSHRVPMQVHRQSRHITFSFDRLYFALILVLVTLKVVTGHVSRLHVWVDVFMCLILGVMTGRLAGICLRVRALKIEHGFIPESGWREEA
jgi:hypothetical protein